MSSNDIEVSVNLTKSDVNTNIEVEAKQNIITDHIILSSSTTDSTKKFKITVDDSGALTTTEVTA